MATLAVQEAMGLKVDREAVATLVLPQLWAMSMGPLLTVSQFKRFMDVIKKLGERVEKEHDQYLRDSQQIEDRSAVNGRTSVSTGGAGGVVDFESLVGNSGASTATVKTNPTSDASKTWEDDVWGSIFSSASGVSRRDPLQQAGVNSSTDNPGPESSASISCSRDAASTNAVFDRDAPADTVAAVIAEDPEFFEPASCTIPPRSSRAGFGSHPRVVFVFQQLRILL